MQEEYSGTHLLQPEICTIQMIARFWKTDDKTCNFTAWISCFHSETHREEKQS